MIDVMIKLFPGGRMPQYMSAGAAGLDCYAREKGRLPRPEASTVGPFGNAYIHRAKIPLGFALSLPDGYAAFIDPRSGLGSKEGIVAGIGARVVDSDYRGEVSALLFNIGNSAFEWQAGDRICQLVIMPVTRAVLHQVDELEVTGRGAGGFGSTGR